VVRRLATFLLIAASVAGIVLVETRDSPPEEGASLALVSLSGYPQATETVRISTSWFCPGAAAGDGITSASVVISNPGDTEMKAAISFLGSGESESESVVVPARSRESYDILRGLGVGVVAPVVEIVGSVGSVEQRIEFAAGNVTSQCASQTSPTWYFADGHTLEGSKHRLVLVNPFPESAVVNVSFTTLDGERNPSSLQGLILPARSARSISLTESGARDERRIAVEVRATTGQIVASRIQHYLGGGRLGYSTTLGNPVPLTEYWFASGRTGANLTEQLIAFNPGEEDVTLNIAFFGDGITGGGDPSEGEVEPLPNAQVTVAAGAIQAISTDEIADLPKGDHSMFVSVVDGGGIVVEHVLSQSIGRSFFTAVTNGIPGPLVSRKWLVPTGVAEGSDNLLSVLNASNDAGTITVFAVGPGGTVAVPELTDVPLAAAQLLTIEPPESARIAELLITSSVPLVVQRRTSRGSTLVGFGIVGALPVRGAR
jgi:hypothetical protein